MGHQQTYDVCHLTLLNAALHSRIFYKEALTAQQNGLQVCIIGQDDSTQPYEKQGVSIVPINGNLNRWQLHWHLLRLALHVRAGIYHIHTPELLLLALLLKTVRRVRIVYDAHEDFASNLKYGNAYQWLPGTRKVAAWYVRTLEKLSRVWVDYYLYAESCYSNMLGAPIGKHAVLPNYYAQPDSPAVQNEIDALPQNMPVLGYMGTIARDWGILETLALWRELNQREGSDVYLCIVGVCYDAALLRQVEETLREADLPGKWQMVGGNVPVPYEKLVAYMRACTCISALYTPTLAIRERVPTKFYEAMALQKPVLFTPNPTWDALNARFHFGISLAKDNLQQAGDVLLESLRTGFASCYVRPIPRQAYAWESVAQILLNGYSKLLRPKAA